MKKLLLIVTLFLFSCSFAHAQFLIGAAVGGMDSNPKPNAGGYAFVGFSSDLNTFFLKGYAGYVYTFLPQKDGGATRTEFSGILAKLTPEFTFTEDRFNPFRANVGVAFYSGDYYRGKRLNAPGAAVGLSWGFDVNATEFELVGDTFWLWGAKGEGSSTGRLHLMATIGVLMKLEM